MTNDTKRSQPKWGTIEHKDANGNVLYEQTGLIIGRGDNKRCIDPDEVENLSRLWCEYGEMATILGINVETLKYNFMDQIQKGRSETKQALRKAQIKSALGGNTTMMIWLGKNILGQTDSPINNSDLQPLPWQTPEPPEPDHHEVN
jgi:hypothetical protein